MTKTVQLGVTDPEAGCVLTESLAFEISNVIQGPVIPSHCGEHVSPGKLNNPVPTVKNHTVLDDGIDLEDELKTEVENRKEIFWQTSINGQRPKLRVLLMTM